MRRNFVTALSCALLLSIASMAQAQVAGKPVVVVSISGYAELKDDLQYLAKASDNPELFKQFEGTLEALSGGLDKTKPWGASVTLDGQEPVVVAFLPVTNLDQLLGGLALFIGPAQDAGNGLKQVGPALIKQQDGYAFIAQKAEHLQNLPDPAKALAGLNKQYDVAVAANVQNVPQELRNMALGLLQQSVEQGLEKQETETEAQFELRKQLAAQQLKSVEQMFNEVDKLTVGWSIDRTAKKTFLDVLVTAVAGSKTAQQFAKLKDAQTRFGGVIRPDAPITFNLTAETTDPDEIEQAVAQIKSYKVAVMDMIDKSEEFDSDEEREVIKTWAAEAMDIAQSTVETGQFDIAMSLAATADGPMTLLAGAHIAKGKALDSLVQQMLKMAEKEEEDFPEVKYNALTHKGTTIHSLVVPVPENDEEAEKFTKVFGEKPMLYLGFSADTAWIAMGSGALDSLKAAIDSAASGQKKSVAPMQFQVSLGAIMRMAAELNQDNPTLLPLANAVQPGTDRVRFLVEPIANGERVRIEVEEGVLKLIGMAAALSQQLNANFNDVDNDN